MLFSKSLQYFTYFSVRFFFLGFFFFPTCEVIADSTINIIGQKSVRARDLGITIGRFSPGPWNAITDVAGVKVGHVTLIEGNGALNPGKGPIRTGVTVIIPRDDVWHKKVPAGAFVLNGTGEMTGLAWVAEAGFLEYPIALTNTLNVPRVANGVMSWMFKHNPDIGITDDTLTPVVAECDDSRLNDSRGRHVSEEDVVKALEEAVTGPMAEGTVGAGTGMISYQFKGGIGTSSRRLSQEDGRYTIGVLVNANHGRRFELTITGVPVGRLWKEEQRGSESAEISGNESFATLSKREQLGDQGSIIIVIATDAPVDSRQLQRVARRAALGLARTGATSHHGSGDFILAFSTANEIPHYPEISTFQMTHIADTHLNPILAATVEATEEAIINALVAATTVVGRDGRRAEAISHEQLREILERHAARP
ncbi:P1 family peptidase [Candidatus Nitronereus thalassa]|uniref:P1 family peptidase n=1 Tax=Candidatus Nitronereus thalassa TaxID=3020898 RepID=A0ABU3K7W3_9BACT|nr:P1 family peptidase [Candidatus Nitronereus thalassa]MDT7042452.1 P1 family peptidase [Candidatus Nitronereus thalassa]